MSINILAYLLFCICEASVLSVANTVIFFVGICKLVEICCPICHLFTVSLLWILLSILETAMRSGALGLSADPHHNKSFESRRIVLSAYLPSLNTLFNFHLLKTFFSKCLNIFTVIAKKLHTSEFHPTYLFCSPPMYLEMVCLS